MNCQSLPFLLLMLACFPLSFARRFIPLTEPTLPKKDATLFVVGVDEEGVMQTLLENAGLWEGVEWKHLFQYHDGNYTKNNLPKGSFEAAVYHLRNFGAIGEMRENPCLYTPFLDAMDLGHLVVLIPLSEPLCIDNHSPPEGREKKIKKINALNLHGKGKKDFWGRFNAKIREFLGGHPRHIDHVDRSVLSVIPGTDRNAFEQERENINLLVNGVPGIASTSNPDAWPTFQLVCYAEAPNRTECLQENRTVCTEEFERTHLGEEKNATCTGKTPDCRTCPEWLNITIATTTPNFAPTSSLEDPSAVPTQSQQESTRTISMTTKGSNDNVQAAAENNVGNTSEKPSEGVSEHVIIISAIVGGIVFFLAIAVAIIICKLVKVTKSKTVDSTLTPSDGTQDEDTFQKTHSIGRTRKPKVALPVKYSKSASSVSDKTKDAGKEPTSMNVVSPIKHITQKQDSSHHYDTLADVSYTHEEVQTSDQATKTGTSNKATTQHETDQHMNSKDMTAFGA